MVQFGGQTAINLATKLEEKGVKILGTTLKSINVVEDRKQFEKLLSKLDIPQPKGIGVYSLEEAKDIDNIIGFPVLVRPSYVIGGRGMQVVYNQKELETYLNEALKFSNGHPILIDKYIEGQEAERDAVSDGYDVIIPGICEHIERAGVHSGDSISVYPAININKKIKNKFYSKI